jgi:hypothetical protein
MSQKSQDAIDVLSKVIVDTIDKKLDTANFDKSQTGVVTAVNGNTYTIAVFGSQYNITSDQIFTVGQSVIVTALQGDMKRLVCSPDNVGTMKTVDSKVKVVGDQLSSFIDKDFADTVIRYTDVGKFFNIKDQIDSQIVLWLYNGAPSNSTTPTKDWSTDDAKRLHVGDIYYDCNEEKAYTWTDEYEWLTADDENLLKILKIVSKESDTADGSRRVFFNTPSPPYSKGDVWADYSFNGYMLVCQVSRPISASYNRLDWVVASKYTDDTKADEALDSANKANADLATFKTEYDSDLKVTKEQIEARVTATTYTEDMSSLKKRVSTAESRITQTEKDITLRVEKDDYTGEKLVSMISAQPESVKISAKNIELTGAVTIQNGKTVIDSDTINNSITQIDGSKITTGTIDAEKLNLSGNLTIGSPNKCVKISDEGISIINENGGCVITESSIYFKGIRNKDVLWKNTYKNEIESSDPNYENYSNSFQAQTISIDLSSYSAIILVYDTLKEGTWFSGGGSAGRLTVVLPVNGQTYSYAYPWNTVHWREVTVSYNGITFGNGNERTSDYKNNVITGVIHLEVPISDGVNKNDKVCRPLELYGFM